MSAKSHALRAAVGALTAITFAKADTDVVTLFPVDDAYLSNSGAESDMPWNTVVLDQFGYYGTIKRPLLRFDLSQVPAGATVISARLTLQLIGIYGGQGHESSVWRMPNDAWAEETVTWNSYDQSGAVYVAVLAGTNEHGPRIWNIDMSDWNYAEDLADGAVTFMVRWHDFASGYETDGVYKANSFSSKEGTAAPTLTIEYEAGCAADLNHDSFVNGDDYDFFASMFEAGNPASDLNHDGFVNGDDYDLFASAFENGC
ncbi:MAG: DNRLRE domain-containing protein [Phycisphaerales bacterium]|jgi:hypothetical protein|nr:DNRLRE domain-containing protein [Phycisphaerales bacterium]